MFNTRNWIFSIVMAGSILSGCYKLRGHYGGPQSFSPVERKIKTEDIVLTDGYDIKTVTTGLTYPTGIAFDEDGVAYVTEAGYSYGEIWTTPKLLKIENDGTVKEIARGDENGPWTGIDYKNGFFYISEGGTLEGGRILKISKDGKSIKTIAENLPSLGDHQTDVPVVGDDGYVYFGQGTATNSAVVGIDNMMFGWLQRHPEFHDIPCKDIVLKGMNFKTDNVLTPDKDDKTETGAFSPFGKTTEPHQVIKGQLPCNGAIMRVPIDGGPIELVAWGLRNPFGLAFDLDGKLFTTENGYDTRGSRPGFGTGDVLWEVKKDTWYGWPDYSAGQPMNTKDYTPYNNPEFLLEIHPQTPPKPTAVLDVHSSANGFDFSKNEDFGYKGEAFIALFGDMSPSTGRIFGPIGFKVIRVNINTGIISEFAVNKGKINGPASQTKSGGLERPVAVRFDPTGNDLYIVDFGIMSITKEGPAPKKDTGVIWKISRAEIAKVEKK